MIDERSYLHLEKPLEGVDGMRVSVRSGHPLQGMQGTVLHQLRMTKHGVICAVLIDGRSSSVEIAGGDLVWVADIQEFGDDMSPTPMGHDPLSAAPTGWGVWDTRVRSWAKDAKGNELTGYESQEQARAAFVQARRQA